MTNRCTFYEHLQCDLTFQPALFENIVSETVQHLHEIIKPKTGEEKVHITALSRATPWLNKRLKGKKYV